MDHVRLNVKRPWAWLTCAEGTGAVEVTLSLSLPLRDRVSFKVLVYDYKAINDLTPAQLCDLPLPCARHPRLRQLHAELQLATPVAVKVVGRQVLVWLAPNWNELPLSIRQLSSLSAFKRGLKTYLFWDCYKNLQLQWLPSCLEHGSLCGLFLDYFSIFTLGLFIWTILLCTRYDQATWIWRPKKFLCRPTYVLAN